MANAIPTILKGDDSGAITLTIAAGRTYTGATLVVAYQGVTKTFTNLTPGGTVALMYTHDETATFAVKCAPLLMRLIGPTGGEETVENAEARIRVTDCLAEVNAGGSFVVTPGGGITDPTKVPITDVGDMAARYSLADLKAKVDQIVRVLAQRSLLTVAIAVAVLGAESAFGAVEVQTARLDGLYNDSLVVTNVTGDAGGGVDTNAVRDIIDAQIPNDGYGRPLNAVSANNASGLDASGMAQVNYMIELSTVTNAGAVAMAKEYADGKFLKRIGADPSLYPPGWVFPNIDWYGSVGIMLKEDCFLFVPTWGNIRIAPNEEPGQKLPAYLASTEWHGTNKALADYGITNSIPPAYTDAEAGLVATNTFSANADYALTNLTAETLTLRSGEIGNYVAPTNFTLSLSFADNGRSGDCILYVENPHPFDSEIAVETNTLNLVSADLAKALTLGKATTNIVTFTRVKASTILVGKVEVK